MGKEKVREVENKMNQHKKQFNKMFQVGLEHKHEKRVEMVTHLTNTPIPPLYGLRKDKKNLRKITRKDHHSDWYVKQIRPPTAVWKQNANQVKK